MEHREELIFDVLKSAVTDDPKYNLNSVFHFTDECHDCMFVACKLCLCMLP